MKHTRYALQVIANALWVLGLFLVFGLGQTIWKLVQTGHAKLQPNWTVLWLTIVPDNWGAGTWTHNGKTVSKLLNLNYASAMSWHVMGVWLLASLALGLVILFLLFRLVKRMQQGEYFTAENARLLSLISWVLLWGILGSLILTLAEITLPGMITINFVTLLAAIGIVAGVFALRIWFDYGVALQQDDDAMI